MWETCRLEIGDRQPAATGTQKKSVQNVTSRVGVALPLALSLHVLEARISLSRMLPIALAAHDAYRRPATPT